MLWMCYESITDLLTHNIDVADDDDDYNDDDDDDDDDDDGHCLHA